MTQNKRAGVNGYFFFHISREYTVQRVKWYHHRQLDNALFYKEKCLSPLFHSFLSWCLLPMHTKSLQSCLTLREPVDCSLVDSSVHAILQARILEWVAIPSSRGSSWPRNRTWMSHIACRFFTIWATREAWTAQLNMVKIARFMLCDFCHNKKILKVLCGQS